MHIYYIYVYVYIYTFVNNAIIGSDNDLLPMAIIVYIYTYIDYNE